MTSPDTRPRNDPLRVERDDRGVVTLTLDRPEVKNAFDAALIIRLRETFLALADDADARVVVVTGEGDVFCAGADLSWMSGMREASFDDNVEDSRGFEAMLRAVQDCPRPVVARVNGHALGGGSGLVACADIVVAVDGARFGFTEVRLGLAPAVISPYVLLKIGVSSARHLFLTGERFDAAEAHRLGLVHRVASAADLDAAVAAVVDDLLAGGPGAQAEIKRLVPRVLAAEDPAAAVDATTEVIARLRVSDEGQEGMRAFFERRQPSWRGTDPT